MTCGIYKDWLLVVGIWQNGINNCWLVTVIVGGWDVVGSATKKRGAEEFSFQVLVEGLLRLSTLPCR